jgi:hypothetical protein
MIAAARRRYARPGRRVPALLAKAERVFAPAQPDCQLTSPSLACLLAPQRLRPAEMGAFHLLKVDLPAIREHNFTR